MLDIETILSQAPKVVMKKTMEKVQILNDGGLEDFYSKSNDSLRYSPVPPVRVSIVSIYGFITKSIYYELWIAMTLERNIQ